MRYLAFVVIALAGCATVSAPIPAGKDTYVISSHADFRWDAPAKATEMAMDRAADTCASQGQEVEVMESKHVDKIGLETIYEVRFKCVSP